MLQIVSELPPGTNWNFDVHWYPRIPGVISASSFDGKIGIYNIEVSSVTGMLMCLHARNGLVAFSWQFLNKNQATMEIGSSPVCSFSYFIYLVIELLLSSDNGRLVGNMFVNLQFLYWTFYSNKYSMKTP